MRRSVRLVWLALVALALAPGTWVRTSIPPPDYGASLFVTPLENPQGISGDVKLLGGWSLNSENAHFGGFSALVALRDAQGSTRLLIGSDRGRILEMPLPQDRDSPSVSFDYFADTSGGPRIFVDLESLEFDSESGQVWGAYEQGGRVQRFPYGKAGDAIEGVAVPEMAEWPSNGGAETMMRLADGRFIIIAETSSYDNRAALLFAGDPIGNPDPITFRFRPPEGFSPVDATVLPDGRALILVRKVVWGLPPRFATAIVLVDPSKIAEGKEWSGETIAEISGPHLAENFEGIAAIEQEDGSLDLYLVADDNLSAFQESQMLRLNWKPMPITGTKKARDNPKEEVSDAPS